MIKSLLIKNFQSHKKTVLDLSPGVNVIVGYSTTGKSAIVRAFRWLLTNRPSGLHFKSNFSTRREAVHVKLETTDGQEVEAKKKAGGMSYTASYGEASAGLEFSGVGKSVPDEVTNIVNMTDLNIQTQLEPHFLITSSPGDFARAIDKITKTKVIDDAIVRITTKINTAEVKSAALKANAESAAEALETYYDFDKLERFSKRAAMANAQATRIAARRLQIVTKLRELKTLKRNRIKKVDIKALEKYIRGAVASDRNIRNNHTAIDKISELDELTSNNQVLLYAHGELSNINLQIQNISNRNAKAQQSKRALEALADAIHMKDHISTKIGKLRADIDRMLADLDQCPLCGGDL
jgi:exonuclease SbcC